MNKLEQELYNEGERLVPYLSHNDEELVRHRSSYVFFYNIINADQKNKKGDKISIIDLGFGSGWGSAILSGINNSQIIGVDIGEECKIYAEQNYARKNVEYVIKDAKEFVSEMNEYDYVVSRGVLEHISGGIELISKFKYKERIIIDVPYNEIAENEHHILSGITEKDFKHFENYEVFYEDINGAIYKDYCPSNANMITVVISKPNLKKIGEILEFPILPVRNKEKELISESNKKNRVQWLERESLIPEIMKKIQPALIGLDIGVGIVPHDYLKAVIYVCCEPYQEYINILTEKISFEEDKIYIIQQKDWENSISALSDKSIDSVYLIDVIEHLSKEDGIRLLRMTERVARKQIVIFTPLGFIKQEVLEGGKDAWGLNGAEYQEHKSGWMPEDFDETWSIYACKDFHILNNIGEKLAKPFGAFWAIKNFNNENNFSDCYTESLSTEIKGALFDQLPSKYFKNIEKLKQGELQYQQLQSEHQQLQSEHQQLQSEHQQLQSEFKQLQLRYKRLSTCRAVRYGNIIKKYLNKIGIK